MKRESFLKYLRKLELAFSPKLSFTQELVDLWYEMFEDCNEDAFRLAVDKCIKESEFAPNIAGLMKYYKAIVDEHDEMKEVLNSQYKKICSLWTEEYSSDTFNAIVEYIYRFPKKMRKVEMIELTQRAISFSFDCDGCGRKDKPTIKEYVQGAR